MPRQQSLPVDADPNLEPASKPATSLKTSFQTIRDKFSKLTETSQGIIQNQMILKWTEKKIDLKRRIWILYRDQLNVFYTQIWFGGFI